jgi:hypothetical protein
MITMDTNVDVDITTKNTITKQVITNIINAVVITTTKNTIMSITNTINMNKDVDAVMIIQKCYQQKLKSY